MEDERLDQLLAHGRMEDERLDQLLAHGGTDTSDDSDSGSSSDGVEVLDSRKPSPKHHVTFAPLPQQDDKNDDGVGDRDDNTNHKADSETEAEPPKKSRKIAHKRQRERTLTDQRAALEHITMIGNYHRHCNWRKNQWNWKQRQQEAAPVEEEEEVAAQRPPTTHFVHAEDVRLYGTRQSPAAPWPNSLSTVVSDAPWHREYGDDISPLYFAQTHLSAVEPPLLPTQSNSEQPATTTGPMAPCAETEALLQSSHHLDSRRQLETLDTGSVPKALVLRCWQRAMDAASFSTLQQLPSTDDSTNDATPPSTLFLLEQQKSARDRCRDLPVQEVSVGNKDSEQPPLKCSICGLTFESHDKLLDHVYGTQQQVACSWTRIPIKQRSMISEILEQEVKAQARTLIHLVFTKAKKQLQPPDSNNNTNDNSTGNPQKPEDILDNKKLINWSDVVEILQESLSSSKDPTTTTTTTTTTKEAPPPPHAPPHVTDTLDVRKSMAPLVLNQQVLDAVSYRLTQRYANVQY